MSSVVSVRGVSKTFHLPGTFPWSPSSEVHAVVDVDLEVAPGEIVALADIYDALRSTRPYKEGFSHDQARKIILEGDSRMNAEGHLDPELVALFAEHHRGLAEIWDRLAD